MSTLISLPGQFCYPKLEKCYWEARPPAAHENLHCGTIQELEEPAERVHREPTTNWQADISHLCNYNTAIDTIINVIRDHF